jgi:D-alanine-D-alanine ligase
MKINLAVLFGGKSVEHEVSIISALQAITSIDREKYEVFPIYITKGNELYYGESLKDISNFQDIPTLIKSCQQISFFTMGAKTFIIPYQKKAFAKNKPLALIDVAFPIIHGTNVEDGALQGFLKTLNLPFVGSDVFSSAVCMDKLATKILLQYAGIPVREALFFTFVHFKQPSIIIEKTEERFSYPLIVKPINLGSSIGISRAKDREELEAALDLAFSFADKIIIEEAVTNLMEINCAVLGDAEEAIASECEEPCSSDEILSYSDKYEGGGKETGNKGMASLKRKIPADISPALRERIQKLSVEAFQFLGCHGVARIDYLIDKASGELWLNEINPIPGSLSFYLWEPTGLQYPDLLDKLISLALKRQRREDELTFTFATNILSSASSYGSKGSKK